MNFFTKKTLLMSALFVMSSCCRQGNVVKDFSKLSQAEKRRILPFMLDSLDHEMYGIGLTKNKEDFKKHGGFSGYFITHYPAYSSGGLILPVLRVYNHKGKLRETLIGNLISKDRKSMLNIGGFSKPFDFNEVRAKSQEVDERDAKIRGEVMSKENQNLTQKYYSKEFIQSLDENEIVDVEKYQNAALGKGYDVDCIATTMRETEEETGIKLNKDEMILLDIHSSVLEQKTKAGYDIKTSTTGVCYFMFEMGDVHLDKNGKIKNIKLNNKSIKNSKLIEKNIKYKNNNIILKGFDDASEGIGFIKASTMNKVLASNKKSYYYTASDYEKHAFQIQPSIANAMILVPKKAQYKTCRPISFNTIGKFVPSRNNLNTQDPISSYKPKAICE